MSRLVLVISDLYPARQQPQELPRLAQLEYWLAHAQRTPLVAGWQQWLLEEFCSGRYAHRSWAQVAAAGAGLAVDHAWLATPVHLVAGLDTVRVHPAGLLRLTAEEQQSLAGDFATVFRGSGWTLHATSERELLICSATALHARSTDPARWLGSDPSAGMITGQDARPLRRLGAELEMWLHEHRVNRARVERGLLPASGLWLWGGAETPTARSALERPSPPRPAPTGAGAALQVYGAELFLAGLCQLTGAGSLALALPWSPARATRARAGQAIVHCQLGAAPAGTRLQALEHELIAPLLLQLRRGDWDSLTLLAGGHASTVRRNGWRVWKALIRGGPWWERLLG